MIARLLTVALWSVGAGADGNSELTPEKVAAIRQEQSKAYAAIDKKYGNKKQAELTPAERKAREQERNAASRAVMEQAGTDDKAFSRYETRLGKDEHAQMKQEEARLQQLQQSAKPAGEGAGEESEPEELIGDAANELLGISPEPNQVKSSPVKKAAKKKRDRKK